MNSDEKHVAIIGLGYVGLPLSIAASNAGKSVIGFDVSEKKISQIRSGLSPIEDVTNEALQNSLENGLEVTSDFKRLSEASIVIICVPTPLKLEGDPDLSHLEEACTSIANNVKDGTLVINESTSYPGTTRNFIPNAIKNVNAKIKLSFAVAPERVDPANKDWNFQNTPRLLGAITEEALFRAFNFYKSFCDHVIKVRSPEIAELAKLIENTFRQINIAFVNGLLPLADSLGLSMTEVLEAAATKPYGFMQFKPGVGVGGHCIPIDPVYLSWYAQQKEVDLELIEIAQKINKRNPIYLTERIKSLKLPNLPRILIIGMSYKPGVSDIRESPSLELFELLKEEFADVSWWDPLIEKITDPETKRSRLDSIFDLVIVAHCTNREEILETVARSKQVLDFTGTFKDLSHVTIV